MVIDSIDDLTINSSNALLKILEEPPKNSVFVLISHRLSKVLSTLRSRSQLVFFRPLKFEEFKEFITSRVGTISPKDQNLLLYLSGSSPGLASMIYFNGGLEIFKNFLKVIVGLKSSRFDFILSNFLFYLKEYNKKYKTNKKIIFTILRWMFYFWIVRMIKLLSSSSDVILLKEEKEAFEIVKTLGSTIFWADVLGELLLIFDEADIFSLDLSHVLLDIFARLKGTIPLAKAF